MVEKDEHEQWVMDLSQRMSMSYVSVHRHVVDRLAVLLGRGEVQWVDGQLEERDRGVAGQLSVFTGSVIALVELENELQAHSHLGGPPMGTTNVRLLPRRSLKEIRLVNSESEDRNNSPYVWSRSTRGQLRDMEWPGSNAPVELHYEDATVVVNSHIGAGGQGFDAFMASLVEDLGK